MMRSPSGIYVAWRELLLASGRSREVPRVLLSSSWSWSMQPRGVRHRQWGAVDRVLEGTYLLGVAKLELVSERELELLPCIQEWRVKVRPLLAECISIDLPMSKWWDWCVVSAFSAGTIEPLLVSAVDSKVNKAQLWPKGSSCKLSTVSCIMCGSWWWWILILLETRGRGNSWCLGALEKIP